MSTMSNICHESNSRKAIKSLEVITFTAFAGILSCTSPLIAQKNQTKTNQKTKNKPTTKSIRLFLATH